jgi:uncharacterized protein YggE
MAALISLASSGALAADGITVGGTGSAKGKATEMIVEAQVTGDAELAADAVVKYRDSRKRAVAALEGLKIDGLSVESDGSSVTTAVDPQAAMMAMRGMATAAPKQRVSVGEKLRIIVKGTDKMDAQALMDATLKVLDTAKDSGLVVGDPSANTMYAYQTGQAQPIGLATFKLGDPDSVRQQAYKSAVDDAKAKARKLADMAGVKLGPIASIEETVAPMDVNPQSGGSHGDEFTSKNFGDIAVNVRLTVRFDIAK